MGEDTFGGIRWAWQDQTPAETELVQAVMDGDVRRACELLKAGTPMGVCPPCDNPLFIEAIWRQNAEMVRLLLEYGADVRQQSAAYCALECAVQCPSTEITGILLERGVDPAECGKRIGGGRHTGVDALYYWALRYDQVRQVELIEAQGWGAFDPVRGARDLNVLLSPKRRWASLEFLVRRGMAVPRHLWRVPDVAKFLAGLGLRPEGPAIDWEGFRYRATPMSPEHPLWPGRCAVDLLEKKEGEALVRPATREELAAIASFGVHPSVLEFYSHFMPASRRGPGGMFDDIDWLAWSNDAQDEGIQRCGYFQFGSDGCGDMFVFGLAPQAGRFTPPVVLFSHEVGYDGTPCEEVAKAGTAVAADVNELLQSLATGAWSPH